MSIRSPAIDTVFVGVAGVKASFNAYFVDVDNVVHLVRDDGKELNLAAFS